MPEPIPAQETKGMQLVDSKSLAVELGCPEALISRLRRQRKIPAIKLGYRTYRYELPRVVAALSRLEITAIGLNRRSTKGGL